LRNCGTVRHVDPLGALGFESWCAPWTSAKNSRPDDARTLIPPGAGYSSCVPAHQFRQSCLLARKWRRFHPRRLIVAVLRKIDWGGPWRGKGSGNAAVPRTGRWSETATASSVGAWLSAQCKRCALMTDSHLNKPQMISLEQVIRDVRFGTVANPGYGGPEKRCRVVVS